MDDLLRLQRAVVRCALLVDALLELLLEADIIGRRGPLLDDRNDLRELREHELRVADDCDVRTDVAPDLERVDVDLDNLRRLRNELPEPALELLHPRADE